ncbi:NEW3 domain-containing protein [Occultella kanbiaonis]|uniref:golvesin C-terminal-like domain-containing protein n=1 Tax=Occultella kanbiaonis TaxID=2675754 RepID=UPI0012B9F78B|nr:NEW3 domain-containing protein [Occultella kanbiaonis]
MSRRNAVRLLLTAAVLPPVIGALADPTQAASRGPRPRDTTAPPPADALRRVDKPNLTVTPITTLTGPRHRVTFSDAVWDGGRTVVRDLEVAVGGEWVPVTTEAGRFDEQWVVFTGATEGDSLYIYDALETHWVAFDSCTQVGERTVELHAAAEGVFDLVLRWSLDGDNPELQYTLEALRDDDFLVGYQSFDVTDLAGVDEVLCGALQHARVVQNDYAPKSAWEMFAPMTLTQRTLGAQVATLGVYIPAEVLAFEHERALGADRQPFGLSLRNDSLDVVPSAYAPQVGRRTPMAAGEKRGYALGVCALPTALFDAYTDLARGEYAYASYRQNVYDTSLTDAIHNMVDLLSNGPDADDSVDFVPSYSGWWSRAKGFIDVENDDAVRTAVAGVLLSAHYLTTPVGAEAGTDLYTRRGRDMIEYHLSRTGTGFTPIKGSDVYDDVNLYRLGGIPFDAVTLNSIDQLTRRQNGGVHARGLELALANKQGGHRSPFAVALAAHELTGDPSWLRQARLIADAYVRDDIETPYTTNNGESSFGYGYSRYWSDLVLLYELTGEDVFLTGAHREAQRFVTQTQMRPVPGGSVTVGEGPTVLQQYDWDPSALPDYPATEVSPEEVPAWTVSTNGLTFEQLSTLKVGDSTTPNPGGGFVLNPCWAGSLLRLAHYTGDELLGDIAENLVVGRFGNYPGYYSRQHQAVPMRPDFPLTGPVGVSGVYFHHAPGQLALALDYLFSEHFVRSNGAVDYPRAFEANFVYFKFSTYGHRPGTFYGEDGVWPYFPKGLVEVDNPLVNWLAGVGNDSLYLSLTNSSAQTQTVRIDAANALTGLGPSGGRRNAVELVTPDGARRSRTAVAGQVVVQVPPKGIASVVIRDVTIAAPWQLEPGGVDRGLASHHGEDTDPDSDFGLTRGTLLVRPDSAGYDAYVYIDTEEAATLRYRIGDGPSQDTPPKTYPNEWTIGVDDLAATFSYQVVTASVTTDEVTLHLPAAVAGIATGAVGGEIGGPTSATASDAVDLVVTVRNGTDAALTGLVVTPTVPDGWTLTPVDAPTEVPAGGTASTTYTVTVPAGATLGAYPLTAVAAWTGGTADLEPAQLTVRDARAVLSLRVDPQVLDAPGDTVRFTATIANAGAAPATGPLVLAGQTGWQITDRQLDVTVAPGEVRTHTWDVVSPTAATFGSSYQFRVRWDTVHTAIAQARIRDAGIVIHNELLAPAYTETGEWLRSSLTGWNGIRSRYSAPEAVGGTATWTPNLPEAGTYEVAVWYPSNAETTDSAAYVVTHAGGTDELVISQRSAPNNWRTLGTYEFAAGTAGNVTLEVRNAAFHRTSAVRFLPIEL